MSLPSNQLSHIKFNNFVVLTRAKVKQILVHIIHRMTREIPKYKNYKGDSEEVKNKKKKKGNRLAKEIKIMKKLKKDDITKFALQFDKNADAILNDTKANMKLRVLVKLAQHKALKNAVDGFRRKYPNWKLEVPNIIKNIELKKKGMQLNEDIARGETDRMRKLDKYPDANGGLRKLSENANLNGSTDSLNSWNVTSKVNQTAKNKLKKNPRTESESSDDEEASDVENDDESNDEEEDQGENNELALKLSNALKKIAPESGEEEESDDKSAENDEGSSEDEFEEERRRRKMELIKQSKTGKDNVNNEESSSEEDEEDEESGEDDFEEERKRRKMELIERNNTGKSNLENESNSEDDDDEEEEEEEEKRRKMSLLNGNVKKSKTSDISNKDKTRKINKKDSNKHIANDGVSKSNKDKRSLVEKSVEDKTSLSKLKEKPIKAKEFSKPKEAEKVVDDFFLTKDNREYLSTVKPNVVPETVEKSDEVKPKPQFIESKPKDIYRRGKKVVLNRNRASFSNFEKSDDYRNQKPFGRKFDSEKTERFGRNNVSNDKFARNNVSNDKFGRNSVSNDKFARNNVSNDKFARNNVSNDKFARNNVSNDKFARNNVSNHKFARNNVSNDKFARNNVSNDKFGQKTYSNDRFGHQSHSTDFARSSDAFHNGRHAPPRAGEKLHPSWEAKKRHQPTITHFKGKKIKFDE